MIDVLLSIRPKWCNLIASSKKTIEVRKNRTNLCTPFRCFIYCTKDKSDIYWSFNERFESEEKGNGKVIGEFICDRVDFWSHNIHDFDTISIEQLSELSCVSEDELLKYADLKYLYGWHISNLVLYDNPKELSEFYRELNCKNPKIRPPQSYSYVIYEKEDT